MIRHLITTVLAALALAGAFGAAAATEVNKASAVELQAVKGIGPALSTKITQARQKAPFKDWPDLVERVSGVGPGNAARFSQAGLTVAGAAYQPAASTAKPGAAKAVGEKKADRAPAAKKASQS